MHMLSLYPYSVLIHLLEKVLEELRRHEQYYKA